MIVKIFTGPLNYDISLYKKDENEYIIGVDQGCSILIENSIDIDLGIGDFDSATVPLERIQKYANKVQSFASVKDYTDTYLAIEEALKLNPERIIIYGGLGSRIDHTLANIKLLKLGNIMMMNDQTTMFMLRPGTYNIEHDYKYISFFADEEVTNLLLKGFKYELSLEVLDRDNPLCISNQGNGTISFDEGVILVIQNNEN